MASEFMIERLDPKKLDELIDAQNRIFADYIVPMRSSKEFFLDFLRSVGGDLANVLVALNKGEIVGYVNPVVNKHEGWIGGVGVLSEFRRQGIGTSLMKAAEHECKKKGVRVISLEVIEGNNPAQGLYDKLGYVVTRKYVSAEGKPQRFEGYGPPPAPAFLQELIPIHEKAYKDTCWQRRKVDALVQSATGAECYKVKGGFVVVRTVETNGFIPFLGVVPEMRGKGVGTALAKFALTRLWNLGTFKVALYNVNDELPTLRLLDKFGFKVTLKQLEMRKQL